MTSLMKKGLRQRHNHARAPQVRLVKMALLNNLEFCLATFENIEPA